MPARGAKQFLRSGTPDGYSRSSVWMYDASVALHWSIGEDGIPALIAQVDLCAELQGGHQAILEAAESGAGHRARRNGYQQAVGIRLRE